MSQAHVIILHAPGTNRDREAAQACQLAGGLAEIVHINQLAAGERALEAYQMLVLPGGFSYGDDLGAGRLWSNDLLQRFRLALDTFVAAGKPVLGICNGFQALVKAGYLPGPAPRQRVTLTFNRSEHFECRWVRLKPNYASKCLFTAGLEVDILCPVAHGEGRLAVPDAQTLQALYSENLIALTYTPFIGEERLQSQGQRNQPGAAYPSNPNGSVADIAGLCNAAGNVLGLMPHPEDHVVPQQHPRWTRGESGELGIGLFINGVRAAEKFV
ncbi:MAG: phosphoribosylformylglycinamidine synthase subunit PurQ [Anaerolineae bacterium]